MLVEKLDQGGEDIKTICMIFVCFFNIAATGNFFTEKLLKETCVLTAFKHLLEIKTNWHTDVLNSILSLLDFFLKVSIGDQELSTCFKIAKIGMKSGLDSYI